MIDLETLRPIGCPTCKHFDQSTLHTCQAFPDGIPQMILSGEFDHRNPFPNTRHPSDRGTRFEFLEAEEDKESDGEDDEDPSFSEEDDAEFAEWQESKHRRGKPGNKGQFGPGGGGGGGGESEGDEGATDQDKRASAEARQRAAAKQEAIEKEAAPIKATLQKEEAEAQSSLQDSGDLDQADPAGNKQSPPATTAAPISAPSLRPPPPLIAVQRFGERLQKSKAMEEVKQFAEWGQRLKEAEERRTAARQAMLDAPRDNYNARKATRAAFEEADEALESLSEDTKDQIHGALKAEDPVTIPVTFPETLNATVREGAKTGAAWLSERLENAERGETLRVSVKPSVTGRAYYGGSGAPEVVALGRQDTNSAATTIHELGHALEQQLIGVRGSARFFLYHRVGAEKPTSMREATGQMNYEQSEFGRKDNFDRVFNGGRAYYVGKEYTDGATEVVSMGLETLFEDPARFAREDPEYCAFVVGILRGEF